MNPEQNHSDTGESTTSQPMTPLKEELLNQILHHEDPPYLLELPNNQNQAKKYHNEKLRLSLFDKFATYLILGVLVWLSYSKFILELVPFSNYYVQILSVGFANLLVIEAFSIIISIIEEVNERKYGFSTRSNRKVFKDLSLSLLLQVILFEVLLLIIYSLMTIAPRLWWVYAFIAYFAISVVLMILAPVLIIPLFMKIEPLPECEIKDRVRHVADAIGITYTDIYLLHLSDQTTKANAAVIGFGKTTKIVLGDTLLSSFRKDEIEVVMAHEIGHKKHKDMFRFLVFQGVVALVSFYLVNWVFTFAFIKENLGYTGLGDPASISFFLLLLTFLMEFMNVISLWYSRRRERAADDLAIQYTKNLQAFKSAFLRLAIQNLSYLYPSKLEVIFFYSHPPILERMTRAEQQFLNTT